MTAWRLPRHVPVCGVELGRVCWGHRFGGQGSCGTIHIHACVYIHTRGGEAGAPGSCINS